jgi:hypothetical protein
MKMTRDVLAMALLRLQQALACDVTGREREWAEQLGEALTWAERALQQHTTESESASGVFAEVDLTRPSLVRQVGALCREHGDLLERARALQQEAQRAARAFTPPSHPPEPGIPAPHARDGGVLDFGELRQRVEGFIAALERHREGENSLVVESVTTDLGAGD